VLTDNGANNVRSVEVTLQALQDGFWNLFLQGFYFLFQRLNGWV